MRGVNNHNYGLIMSDDQKEKLRVKAIKRYKTKNHPRNKIVIDLYTGIYYSSAKECAMSLNIIYSTFKCKLNRNQNEKRFKYI